jgi:hypothetical protein
MRAVNLQSLQLQHNLLVHLGGRCGSGVRDMTRLTSLTELRLDSNFLCSLPFVLGALHRDVDGFSDVSRPKLASLRVLRCSSHT